MIVPITVPPPSAYSTKLPLSIAKLGHDELFLIELQGTLDVQCPESETKDGQLIGTLNMSDINKPTLVIGHHLLEGKVVALPKPLGVLHKHVRNTGASAVHTPDDSDSEGEGEGEGEVEKQRHRAKVKAKADWQEVRWAVTAVVNKKVVFSKRPMPTAKPASTTSRRT